MRWFDRFKKAPAGNLHVMSVDGKKGVAYSNVRDPASLYIRRGKWVIVGEGKIGIVNDLANLRSVGVMLVNEKGENLLQTFYPYGDLTIARYEQIPLPRRPDRDTGARLGYI